MMSLGVKKLLTLPSWSASFCDESLVVQLLSTTNYCRRLADELDNVEADVRRAGPGEPWSVGLDANWSQGDTAPGVAIAARVPLGQAGRAQPSRRLVAQKLLCRSKTRKTLAGEMN